MRLGGDPLALLDSAGVDSMALYRVLEIAADQHKAFMSDFYSGIASAVQEGVVKALGGH